MIRVDAVGRLTKFSGALLSHPVANYIEWFRIHQLAQLFIGERSPDFAAVLHDTSLFQSSFMPSETGTLLSSFSVDTDCTF
jgi:hypothetical protein